ncbi:MAG: hypothetical protein C5B51_25100 [Terriglobia bacterium]|nr:MAG: hypothetical protein C5B51_25100 [Terriglobia bacterium]
MPASKLKVLSVRLPESDLRRYKSISASRGVSLQDAVHQALESWANGLRRAAKDPLDSLEGSLAGVDVRALMERERQAELRKDQRRSR